MQREPLEQCKEEHKGRERRPLRILKRTRVIIEAYFNKKSRFGWNLAISGLKVSGETVDDAA